MSDLSGTEQYNIDDSPPETLDAFFIDVEKKAYRIAYIALNQRDEALDVVQDTMLRMFQSYAHKPAHEWRPLFYRILNNRITDSHRSNQLKRKLQHWFGYQNTSETDTDDMLEQIPSSRTGEEPMHQLQSDASMVLLHNTLHNLPLRQQQAFLLRHWEGMSTEETASAMGCSTGSVKTHLSRALTTLKGHLQAHYEHYGN